VECKTLLCDVCGRDAHIPATHRGIVTDALSPRSKPINLDLCDEHWGSLVGGVADMAAANGTGKRRTRQPPAAGLAGSNGKSDSRFGKLDPDVYAGRFPEIPCPVPGCDRTPRKGVGFASHIRHHVRLGDITERQGDEYVAESSPYSRLNETTPRRKSPAGVTYPLECPVRGCTVTLHNGGNMRTHLDTHRDNGDTIPPRWVEFLGPTLAERGFPKPCVVPGCDHTAPTPQSEGAHMAAHVRRGEWDPINQRATVAG
jgi:hypothetical protein